MLHVREERVAALLDIALRDDGELRDDQGADEVVDGVDQGHFQGLVVDGVDGHVVHGALAGVVGLRALDGVEHVGVLRGGLRGEYLLPGVLKVLGADGVAVAEDRVAQVEGIGLAVLADVPALGKSAALLDGAVFALADQGIQHGQQHLISFGGGLRQGTQVRQVHADGHAQRLVRGKGLAVDGRAGGAIGRRGFAGRRAGGFGRSSRGRRGLLAGAGGQRKGHHQQRQHQCSQSLHGFSSFLWSRVGLGSMVNRAAGAGAIRGCGGPYRPRSLRRSWGCWGRGARRRPR